MKKLTILLLSFCMLTAHAQKSTDAKLNSRLQAYLEATRQLDFEKVMDFMHPRLFAIAPRQQLVKTMEQAFNNPQLKIRFDSMAVVAISPAFQYEKGTYRKIDYYMQMTLSLDASQDLRKKELSSAMQQSFAKAFPGKRVRVDTVNNSILVTGNDLLFAIKGAGAAEWLFLGYEKNNPQLLERLYPQAVRRHFKVL